MTAQNRKTCPECGQGWRDMWLVDRHRQWERNVPMMDMDGLLWEYDNRLVIGLIEYKHKCAPSADGAQLETLLTTADRLTVPAFQVRYLDDDDEPLFSILPLNPLADFMGAPDGWISEDNYIDFLYRIRNRTVSQWERKTILFNRKRLRRIRKEMQERALSLPIRLPGRQDYVDVGWRLAEEIAWARPERPGPEWWTLLDIAQDARDDTRRAMPGHDYLMARAKRSRRTIDRYLAALTGSSLLTVVTPAAPGQRVIYEIPVIRRLPGTDATNAGTRTYATNAGTRQDPDVCQNDDQRVPITLPPTCATNAGAPPVSTRHSPPSIAKGPDFTPAVEGSGLPAGQDQVSPPPPPARPGRHRKRREPS